MSQIFSPKIITKTPSRNRFNLAYYSHVTTRMGDLTPVLCKKVLPGDPWRVNLSSVTRLAPLANPVYDRVRITYDAFFVQNRILDPDWKRYVSPDPEESGNPEIGMHMSVLVPAPSSSVTYQEKVFRRGGLMDMLGFQFCEYSADTGIPQCVVDSGPLTFKFSAYPFLGYYKIWDNWYRNERFQKALYPQFMTTYDKASRSLTIPDYLNTSHEASGSSNEYGFCSVNYGKDLYTTCLDTPLVGGPVNIPAGSSKVNIGYDDGNEVADLDAAVSGTSVSLSLQEAGAAPNGNLVVDMKNAVLGTIQELKFAYALFSFYMKDTYNGNRYVEFMQAHFGVNVPDATLERSLFLGRITQWINFSEIYQTSGSTGDTNTLGDYAGVGVGNGAGRLFDASFDEHGYLYIMMSIRPNATYFQGVDRKFFYGSRFDELYFPVFQNVGDKPIYTMELYNSPDEVSVKSPVDLSWTQVNASKVFGYNRANAEYIWFHDEMHGNFLNPNGELNWTFARTFTSQVVLGDLFSRVKAIQNPFTFTDSDSLNYYTDILFDIKALRPVVRYEHY